MHGYVRMCSANVAHSACEHRERLQKRREASSYVPTKCSNFIDVTLRSSAYASIENGEKLTGILMLGPV